MLNLRTLSPGQCVELRVDASGAITVPSAAVARSLVEVLASLGEDVDVDDFGLLADIASYGPGWGKLKRLIRVGGSRWFGCA